jgi:hypothetical protein
MIILTLFGLLLCTQSHAMEPITSAKLRSMHDDAIAGAIRSNADTQVHDIYNNVRQIAMRGEKTKYVHIVKHATVGRVYEKDIIIDDVKDAVLSELRRLFPGCDVTYVERRPDADIFSESRREDRRRPADVVDRAFVVDWTAS